METDKKLTPAELEELNNFLLFANAGFTIIGTMDLHWAEGFLCGICSAPIPLLPSQWHPLLFPEEGFEFKTEEEAKGITSLVLRHYNMVDRSLHKDRFEPIYEWHKFNDQEPREELILRWCRGYIHGIQESLDTLDVGVKQKDSIIAIMMLPFFVCATSETEKDKILRKARIMEEISGRVRLIFTFCQELRNNPRYAFHTPNTVGKNFKIGMNYPCPCGSGKNFKKCCLTAMLQQVMDVYEKI